MAESTKPISAITATAAARRARGYGQGARLALLGVAVNFCLALIKIVSGVLGNCYALIADGIESTLDIFGSLAIWFGLKVAAAPPDEAHPYGHGKAEPLASVVVALAVLLAAMGLAIESVRELNTPRHTPERFTLAVLVAVIVVKETLFRKVAGAGEELGSGAVKTDAWHHRSDAITSAGAFIGIGIAIVGGPGWEQADDWAALFTCGIIGFNGWRLLVPALQEIMDTAPPKALEDAVRQVAASVPGVVEVEKCHLRKMGIEFYVDIHIGVAASLTVRDGHRIAHEVKDAILAAHVHAADVLVHIEPVEVAG